MGEGMWELSWERSFVVGKSNVKKKAVKEKRGEGENIKLLHSKRQAQLVVNPHRKSSLD